MWKDKCKEKTLKQWNIFQYQPHPSKCCNCETFSPVKSSKNIQFLICLPQFLHFSCFLTGRFSFLFNRSQRMIQYYSKLLRVLHIVVNIWWQIHRTIYSNCNIQYSIQHRLLRSRNKSMREKAFSSDSQKYISSYPQK